MKKIFFLAFIFMFIPLLVKAAEVYISAPEGIHVGDTFEITVNADSGGVLINSVSAVLDYDEDLLDFAGYQTDNTVMGILIESPDAEKGKVSWSGIIPGGVAGLFDPEEKELADLPVMRLFFFARQAGEVKFTFLDSTLLEHDGAGTPLSHAHPDSVMNILESVPGTVSEISDKIPPDNFEISLLESGFFSRTPSMLIFGTSDSGLGVKEYKRYVRGFGWKEAESPLPISRGIFPQSITIRAFDFAGNYQEASIIIAGIVPPKILMLLASFFALVLCLYGMKMIKYRV